MSVTNDNTLEDYFGEDAADILNRAVDARLAESGHQTPQRQPQQPQQQQNQPHQGEAATDALLDCILDGDSAGAERIASSERVRREQSLNGEGPAGQIGMDQPRGGRGIGMGG